MLKIKKDTQIGNLRSQTSTCTMLLAVRKLYWEHLLGFPIRMSLGVDCK